MANNLMILISAINLMHEISPPLYRALLTARQCQCNVLFFICISTLFFHSQDLLHSKDAFDILYCRSCHNFHVDVFFCSTLKLFFSNVEGIFRAIHFAEVLLCRRESVCLLVTAYVPHPGHLETLNFHLIIAAMV